MLLTSWLAGMDMDSKADLLALAVKPEYNLPIKILIGINHLTVFILCPLIYLHLFYRHRIMLFLGTQRFSFVLLIWGVIMLFCTYPLMGYLAMITERIAWPDWMTDMDKSSMDSLTSILKMDTPLDLMVNLIIVAILPGIGEELLFRGIIQNEILHKTANVIFSIIITAIIFSAFHFQVTGFLPKMLIGAILGYIYFIGKDIRLPMLLHTINNGMATLALYFADLPLTQTEPMPEADITIWSAMISLILSAAIGYYIYKSFYKTDDEPEFSP